MSSYDFSPEKIFHMLVEAGDEWAEAQYHAQVIEESLKPLLNQLAIKQDAKSMAEATAKALASKEYTDQLAAAAELRRLANKAKVKYDSLRKLADLRQTQAANQRVERKASGAMT